MASKRKNDSSNAENEKSNSKKEKHSAGEVQKNLIDSKPSISIDHFKYPLVVPTNEVQEFLFIEDLSSQDTVPKKRKLISSVENVTFEATNTTTRSLRLCNSCNFAVGRFDRKHNGLTLYKAAPAEVFVKLNNSRSGEKSAEVLQPSSFEKYTASRNLLSETFGTKKKKQEIRSARNNAINVEGIQNEASFIQEQISITVESAASHDIPIEQNDASGFIENPDKPIPPYNPKATSSELIYDVEALAPQSVMSEIDSDYISSRKGNLLSSLNIFITDSLESQLNAKQIVFLDCMITFLTAVPQSKVDPDKVAKLINHNGILAFLLKNFTQKIGNRHEMSSRFKDKLLFYICVLFLFLHSFKNAPLNQLASDLKLSSLKLYVYFKSLGCKSNSSGNEKLVSLVAPLKFPTK